MDICMCCKLSLFLVNRIAFVEFKKESIAKKVQQKKQGAKIEGRVLVVDFVGETKENKVTKANDDDGKEKGKSMGI